jgi:response regulator RpfG family c-di-GMP phosphodiesterase
MIKRQILIIDSNTNVGSKLKENFERDGFNVELANGRDSAINFLNANRPHLILSEILLDDCDGVALLKEIKDNKTFTRIPYIVLTSANDSHIEIKCFRCGADEFFVKKNITRQELMLKIEVLLDKFSIYNQLERGFTQDLLGKLNRFNLKKLLKMIKATSFSGKCFLYSKYDDVAELLFDNGQLKNAILNNIEGIDVLFKIDKMKDAYFTLKADNIVAVNFNVDQSTDTIISLLDE